jgi:hypothetical protein
VRFKEPLPSYVRQSQKGPLKVRSKEPRGEETDSNKEKLIGRAEDQYELPPREEPCEFCFPEDIVVPRLPGSEAEMAGNEEEGLQARAGPEDSEERRKCTSLSPPRAKHCSPGKAGGLIKETQMIVQEEEDPGSGGDPKMVPGQEQPPEEGGLESGHRPGKQREPTPCESEGTPLTLKTVHIS